MQDTMAAPAGVLHDGYRLKVAPSDQRIGAKVGGTTIAESNDVLIMQETGYAPVYYFPRADVAAARLIESDLQTHCPFKGNARYWSVEIDGTVLENAAWSYDDPFDEATMIRNHVAFYWDKIDAWTADGAPLPAPTQPPPASNNPLVPWLLRQASQPASTVDLLREFSAALEASGFPVFRVRFLIQTLNPLLFARGYTWDRGRDEIEEFQATHAGVSRRQYQDSPFAAIINGEGGIRRRLEGADARLDYPILEDLVAEGATDYVAMPMRFSDGQINILVVVSDKPGGFSTEQLGHLYEILANLSRMLEVHALRASSKSLLSTYLGHEAGGLVMDGLIKRGDAQELPAVIWMTDLRRSTELAEQLPKQDYLVALNDYFDCVAGSVIDHGGDVLKFIGDAVLAIFPIDPDIGDQCSAYDQALDAVQEAEQRMSVINTEREAMGQPALNFGTGLHCDTLTFGNIGTEGRLDFTVVGSGVNKTARLAALCKDLNRTILISGFIASNTSRALTPVGSHCLAGFSEPQEIFTLEGRA